MVVRRAPPAEWLSAEAGGMQRRLCRRRGKLGQTQALPPCGTEVGLDRTPAARDLDPAITAGRRPNGPTRSKQLRFHELAASRGAAPAVRIGHPVGSAVTGDVGVRRAHLRVAGELPLPFFAPR